MVETVSHWMDDTQCFYKKEDVEQRLKAGFENQRDPKEMIDEMISIIPADSGKFRNVFPKEVEDSLKQSEVAAWENKI